MANWKYILDIKDLWTKAEAQDISPQEFCRKVTEVIAKMPCFDDDQDLQTISDDFFYLAEDEEADWGAVDEVMADLYDWGDTYVEPFGTWPSHRLCWIKAKF